MTPHPKKVCIIGLGYFSAFHIEAWQKRSDIRLVSATDLDPERRAWAAETYGLAVAGNLTKALDHHPDIVDIVAPPSAHVDILKQTMAQDRTIICQKPFCTSIAEAKAMAELAQQSSARIVIHENFRFQPWYRTIKSVLESGTLGQVYSARFALRPGDGRGADAYLSRQPAFQTMPRLLIHETGVHFIDLFRWLFGEVTHVYSDLRRLNPVIKGEDAGTLILSHANGVQSVFDGNRLADHDTDNPRRTMGEMTIEAEGGTLTLNGQGEVWMRPFQSRSAEPLPLQIAPDDSFGGGCVANLINHVADAVVAETSCENEVDEYLPVIELTEAAYRSNAEGRRLEIPDSEKVPA